MILKMLYKKTSTGKIQQWQIFTVGNTITSRSGQLGGKITESRDIIKVGKNIGKANETAPEQQAEKEAQARWDKKKRSGYVESLAEATNECVDTNVIDGGYLPQLAHSFDKRGKDIIYPCAAQPKLDGGRGCFQDASMWSRTRKLMISVPHIVEELNDIPQMFKELDGELYNHNYKDDFETIMHIIRQQTKPSKDHKLCQYHVYDIPSDKPFIERMQDLRRLDAMLGKNSSIIVVETVLCKDKEELMAYTEKCLERGYEGAMARNLYDGGYENKRSKHLQKIKVMEDAEYKIVGMEEGKGKLIGHCAAFVCITGDGNKFKAKMKGKQSMLKTYWENQNEYIDKLLTVQFQGLTNKNNVPRFPVGLRLREDL